MPDTPFPGNGLKNFVDILPETSGIYFFKDPQGHILYIGKAKNLKKRVRSYITGHESGRTHISLMLSRFVSIDYIVTRNEHDALLLENNWIKEKKPPYNIIFRDDKTYQSLCVDLSHSFPGLKVVRKISTSRKQLLYGPFCLIGDIKKATQVLLRFFQIRDCTDAEFNRRKRPCLRYDMQLCAAPCVGKVSQEEYAKHIALLRQFLGGKNQALIRHLKSKIENLSEMLEFEKAQEYHQRLLTLMKITGTDSTFGKIKGNTDFIFYEQKETQVCFYLMYFRHGHLLSTEHHIIEPPLLAPEIYLQEFLERFYLNRAFIFPEVIRVETMPMGHSVLASVLTEKSGRAISIKLIKSKAERAIATMAHQNMTSLWQTSEVEQTRYQAFNGRLRRLFRTQIAFNWVEVLDISHQSSKDCVGAKVAFMNGKPYKNEYRRYHVNLDSAGNDYSAMEEILNRRINESHETKTRPDLVIIDGGRGHLNLASQIIAVRRWFVPIIAISKESHAKNSYDQIHMPDRKLPLALAKGDPFLLEVMRMRDEAHRFAITFFKHKQHARVFKPSPKSS